MKVILAYLHLKHFSRCEFSLNRFLMRPLFFRVYGTMFQRRPEISAIHQPTPNQNFCFGICRGRLRPAMRKHGRSIAKQKSFQHSREKTMKGLWGHFFVWAKWLCFPYHLMLDCWISKWFFLPTLFFLEAKHFHQWSPEVAKSHLLSNQKNGGSFRGHYQPQTMQKMKWRFTQKVP